MAGQEGRAWGSASLQISGEQRRRGWGRGQGGPSPFAQFSLISRCISFPPQGRGLSNPRGAIWGMVPCPLRTPCPAMPRAVGRPRRRPRPHLHPCGAVLGSGDGVGALGVPSWGHGLVAGCPRAGAVRRCVPDTRVSSVPGLSHRRRSPTSQVPHRRRHGRFSSRCVQSVFTGKTATRREKSGRQAGLRLGRRDGCPPVAF